MTRQRFGVIQRLTSVLLVIFIGIAIFRVARPHSQPSLAPTRYSPVERVEYRPILPDVQYLGITNPALGRLPVACCHWSDNLYLVCNYNQLRLVNIHTGEVQQLSPPAEVTVWSPTAVWADARQSLVFVSNMRGRDVLEFALQHGQLRLLKRITTPGMREPKGVALSPDGRWLAVGDYEANRLWMFHRDGTFAWSAEVPLAHGVDFGPTGVVVTSLGDHELRLYHWTGILLRRVGGYGWGTNQYIWPTAVLRDHRSFLVSDAHTGTIRRVDFELNQLDWLGGNGVGSGLFNMPYGLGASPTELVVCDTFKDRLIVLGRSNRCRRVIGLRAEQITWTEPQFPATYRSGYVDVHQPFRWGIPGLPEQLFFPAYGGYAAEPERAAPLAVFPLAKSIFNPGGFPYFCWAMCIPHEGEYWLALGYPQGVSAEGIKVILLVDPLGRCCSERVDVSLWKMGMQCVTNEGKPFAIKPCVERASKRLKDYDQAIARGIDPLDAARLCLRPELDQATFGQTMARSFVSPEGKAFWEHWQSGDRRKAGREFDQAIARQPFQQVFLQEVFLRRLLVNEN